MFRRFRQQDAQLNVYNLAIMRQQQDRYQQVYDLLSQRMGLRLPEIERLLDTLRGST